MDGTRKGVGAYLSFSLRGGRWGGVGAYLRLGAYQIFLPSGWALIRGGHKFEVGRLFK